MAIYKLIARFVHHEDGKPFSGERFTVRFFDRDAIKDDLLGESSLSSSGEASILTTTGSFGVGGPLAAERRPDLYCVVCEDGKPIFRTPVSWNVPVQEPHKVSKQATHTHDIGTFRVVRGAGWEEESKGGISVKPVM